MADLEAVDTRLSFDDILEAVQDSKRGRWFLQEFETRVQQRDTHSVLQAIARLESRMEGFGSQSSIPDDLGKVRSAIASARNDLINLGLGKEALSKEGRLFAEVAEMARKAMPVAVDSNAGIVRTLQLVDEIDRTISPGADRGAKFFSADANLFERPPTPPKPVLVQTPDRVAASLPVKKEDALPTGAKLVIRKSSQVAETPSSIVAEEAVASPEPSATPSTDLPAMDNPRIVIIRRKAEDMPEVTLVEASETVSAA
jgi:hypothetical protein